MASSQLEGFEGFEGVTDDGRLTLGHSPINVQNLITELESYPDRDTAELLFNGFQFGFSLGYTLEKILTQKI